MNKIFNGSAVAIVVSVIALVFASGVFSPSKEDVRLGAVPGPTILGMLELFGGVTYGNVVSSSTSATSYTMTSADIGNYNTVIQTLTGGAATFTLPATSTMTNIVPKSGQIFEQCYLPLTNSLTFAAGTGIDLEQASSTIDRTIGANGTGCLKFIRQADSDITVGIVEFVDAD